MVRGESLCLEGSWFNPPTGRFYVGGEVKETASSTHITPPRAFEQGP